MVVVPYQAGGLKTVYKFVLVWKFPVKCCGVGVVIPPSVEPDGTDLSVLGEKLCELGIHKIVVAPPVRIVEGFGGATGAACRVVFASPVDVRVVEVKFYPLAVTFICELADDISTVWGIHNVVVRLFGVPHRESFVVAGCEADVFGT